MPSRNRKLGNNDLTELPLRRPPERNGFAASRCRRSVHWCHNLSGRQENGKLGPFAWLAFHLDPSAMIGDDAVDDRESEPSALADIFCRKEGLEDPILGFGIHATSGIGDAQADKVAAASTRTPVRRRNLDRNRPEIGPDGLP